jgi:hypothetical protein
MIRCTTRYAIKHQVVFRLFLGSLFNKLRFYTHLYTSHPHKIALIMSRLTTWLQLLLPSAQVGGQSIIAFHERRVQQGEKKTPIMLLKFSHLKLNANWCTPKPAIRVWCRTVYILFAYSSGEWNRRLQQMGSRQGCFGTRPHLRICLIRMRSIL